MTANFISERSQTGDHSTTCVADAGRSRAIPGLSSPECPLRNAKRPQKGRFVVAGTGFEPVTSGL